jgi:hypothetical protein
MTYDIYGWVEQVKEPGTVSPWVATIDLSKIVGHSDEFSDQIFGLSKFSRRNAAPFFERGLPGSLSPQVLNDLASIASLELEEGADLGFHGHTYITLGELKQIALPPNSVWCSLVEKISQLQRKSGHSDLEVRFVIWALW